MNYKNKKSPMNKYNSLTLSAFIGLSIFTSAGQASENAHYATIKSSVNGNYLDFPASNHAGAGAVLTSRDYSDSQTWLIDTLFFQTSQIINNEGYCLGLPSWSSSRPTAMNCDINSDRQQWRLEPQFPKLTIMNLATGECLSTAHWDTNQLTMRACNSNSASQIFDASTTTKALPAMTATFESTLLPGTEIGQTQTLDRPGAEIHLATAGQGSNNEWTINNFFTAPNKKTSYIQLEATTPNDGDLCLGLPMWSDTQLTALNCAPGIEDKRQQWEPYGEYKLQDWTSHPDLSITPTNEIALRNKATSQCITISNNPILAGRKLTMRDCDYHRDDQKFTSDYLPE